MLEPRAQREIDNSNINFSKANYDSASNLAKRKSPKWFNKKLYLLYKQLKPENRHMFQERSRFFVMKRTFRIKGKIEKLCNRIISQESYVSIKEECNLKNFGAT